FATSSIAASSASRGSCLISSQYQANIRRRAYLASRAVPERAALANGGLPTSCRLWRRMRHTAAHEKTGRFRHS
ncbi:MAG TPA: hypothetical protein VGE07_27520, partial [Herpetosiphonaceae bacterium]